MTAVGSRSLFFYCIWNDALPSCCCAAHGGLVGHRPCCSYFCSLHPLCPAITTDFLQLHGSCWLLLPSRTRKREIGVCISLSSTCGQLLEHPRFLGIAPRATLREPGERLGAPKTWESPIWHGSPAKQRQLELEPAPWQLLLPEAVEEEEEGAAPSQDVWQ